MQAVIEYLVLKEKEKRVSFYFNGLIPFAFSNGNGHTPIQDDDLQGCSTTVRTNSLNDAIYICEFVGIINIAINYVHYISDDVLTI